MREIKYSIVMRLYIFFVDGFLRDSMDGNPVEGALRGREEALLALALTSQPKPSDKHCVVIKLSYSFALILLDASYKAAEASGAYRLKLLSEGHRCGWHYVPLT
jgi:hypothetical protein